MISSHILQVLKVFLGSRNVDPTKQWQGVRNFSAQDFDCLYQILLEHGLLGFYEGVITEQKAQEYHSVSFLKNLHQGISAQWTTNMHLAALQDWLAEALDSQGVKFLVLKGLPLSERLYANALIRPSSDVDILVNPADWQKTLQVLRGHGFRAKDENLNIKFQKNHFHWQFLCDRFPGVVELHWELTDQRFSFPVTHLFSRTKEVEVSKRKLRVMDPTDEFLYLTNHHATHYLLCRWLYLIDIARFVQVFGEDIDWPGLEDRMSKWGTRKTLTASLGYINSYFSEAWGAASKRKVADFLNEYASNTMNQSLLRYLCDPKHPFHSRVQKSPFHRKLLAFHLINGSRKRLQILRKKIFGV